MDQQLEAVPAMKVCGLGINDIKQIVANVNRNLDAAEMFSGKGQTHVAVAAKELQSCTFDIRDSKEQNVLVKKRSGACSSHCGLREGRRVGLPGPSWQLLLWPACQQEQTFFKAAMW